MVHHNPDLKVIILRRPEPPEVSARERFGLLLQQRMPCWYEQVVVQC